MFRRNKNESTSEADPVTGEAIRAWMVDYLQNKLSVDPSQVPILLRRFPHLSLAAPPTYRDQLVTRGFARMEVTLGTT